MITLIYKNVIILLQIMENTLVLFDYTETISDPYWGDYETFCCIGQGKLSANSVLQQLSVFQGPLNVRINSVGGSVFDGFAIYNALVAYKKAGNAVTVRIEGLAASIASIIAMAGDEVVICQAAMIMVHKPTIDPFWCGTMDASDLQREANALTQIEAVLNDIYGTKTGLGSTKIQNMIDAETWLTPDMAVMLGFADSIEKTVTEQPSIASPVYNHLFSKANAQTKLYVNNAFKITNMSTPNEALLKAVKDNTEKTNGLMAWFQNKFGKSVAKNAVATLANGNPIYYNDGDEFTEGTAVFEDADMQKPLADGTYELQDATEFTVAEGVLEGVEEQVIEPTDSAEVIALRAQVAELQGALNTANASLGAVNSTIEKLKGIKSNYVPKDPKQEFNNKGKEDVSVTDGKSLAERVKARQKGEKIN